MELIPWIIGFFIVLLLPFALVGSFVQIFFLEPAKEREARRLGLQDSTSSNHDETDGLFCFLLGLYIVLIFPFIASFNFVRFCFNKVGEKHGAQHLKFQQDHSS